jgi:signal-transduction protein with cAMP-binding, CBS, and nucleotidyltransferase domain
MITEIATLKYALQAFAGLNDDDFQLSSSFWHYKAYKKGDYYNEYKSVCKYLGFITTGVFRSFIIDKKTDEEKNVFLYTVNGFVVTFKSFINQVPCDYHTQAMTDSSVVYICIYDLLNFFKTPEERYLYLVNNHPTIFDTIPLYHISSYLGIKGPSLSRIRKRITTK